MPRRELTPIEFFAITIPLLMLMAIIYGMGPPVAGRGRARRASCQSNLKQMGLGFLQYTQDYDERLPPVSLNDAGGRSSSSSQNSESMEYGWADTLQPYIKSTQLYHCPANQNTVTRTQYSVDPRRYGYIDYWFNHRLAAQSYEELDISPQTILAGDGRAGDARYARGSLPPKWLRDPTSPAYIHLNGLNLLFSDSHVKWFKPARISVSPQTGPSFALK